MNNKERVKKPNSGPNFNWADLTQECLINILSRLTPEQRWTGPMFVCKSWFSASKDPSLNSVFNLETHFESLTESTRWWTYGFEEKIDSMLRSVVEWSGGSLTEIKTRHCSDRSLNFAAERCPNLEVLSIKNCTNVTDDSMSRITFRCSKLRELEISCCPQISDESLKNIGRNCPNIKVLKRNLMNWFHPLGFIRIILNEYLNALPQDGDLEADAIAKFMPNLECLELGLSKLSPRGLASICEGCTKLEYLDLSGCVMLTSQDIDNATSNLKNLLHLIKPDIFGFAMKELLLTNHLFAFP